MGTLYVSQAAAGYNATPPADDGSQTASNQITWNTTIKAKLADPIKVLADAINTQLTTVLDLSPRAIAANDSAVASDHWRTLQVTGTTTITLSDAATMTNKYVVGIANLGVGTVTVTRATGANTVNGTAADFTIPPKSAVVLGVNQGATGYNIISSTGGNSNNTSLVATTSVVTPLVTNSGAAMSVGCTTDNNLNFLTAGQIRFTLNTNTDFVPAADNTQSIGGAATRIKQVFTPIIDTGTTGSGALKTNNGTTVLTWANDLTTSLAGALRKIGGVTTSGSFGAPTIVATGRATAQTGANASVSTFTVGAADGSFEVSANVLVTVSTTHSFNVSVSYTDEGNTARTQHLDFIVGSNVVETVASVAAVPYAGIPLHIRAKASTAITILTSGTFTTVTYNVEGIIKQTA